MSSHRNIKVPISPLIDKIKMLRVFEHKESFDKYFILICFFFFSFFFGLASFHLYRRVGWVSRYSMYCADLFSSAVPLKSISSKTSCQVLFTPILTALFCQRKHAFSCSIFKIIVTKQTCLKSSYSEGSQKRNISF